MTNQTRRPRRVGNKSAQGEAAGSTWALRPMGRGSGAISSGSQGVALGMDASVGTQHRRRTATAPDRRRGQRRCTDVHESAHDKNAREAALATIDKLNRGVLLLDDNGAVCFANRAAEAMVARNDGLLLRRGRLQFKAVDGNTAFEAFLVNGRDLSVGGGLVLRADSSRRKQPYRVLVSRLTPRHKRDGRGAGYCVFIYEPSGGHQPVALPVLRQLYGLKSAEARLANALFGGQSLAESAKASSISVNTAKSVLKRIFTKCAVHS